MNDKLESKIRKITSDDFNNFDKNLNEAYQKVTKQTGFKGNYSNISERNDYFSHFEVKPSLINNRPIGVEIEYSISPLSKKMENTCREKRRTVAACGPRSKTYKL